MINVSLIDIGQFYDKEFMIYATFSKHASLYHYQQTRKLQSAILLIPIDSVYNARHSWIPREVASVTPVLSIADRVLK